MIQWIKLQRSALPCRMCVQWSEVSLQSVKELPVFWKNAVDYNLTFKILKPSQELPDNIIINASLTRFCRFRSLTVFITEESQSYRKSVDRDQGT